MSTSAQGPISVFRNLVQHAYYKCTSQPLRANDNAKFDYKAIVAGMMRVDRMSGGDVLVERSWSQVRSNPAEIYLIRFPEEGYLDISQDKALNSRVGAGEFVITYGNRPFQAKALGQSGGQYSQVDIMVPSHILRSLLPEADRICGQTFKLDGGASVARAMMDDLICRSSRIEPALAGRLADVGLEAIVSDVRMQMRDDQQRFRSVPSELDRVLRYIDANFSVPGLTGEFVARACQISRRHLHNLMSATDTSFSEYLWERRLAQSDEWLRDGRFNGFNISQIAHMCGFQCGSHFSQLYKERFGVSPRAVRRQQLQ